MQYQDNPVGQAEDCAMWIWAWTLDDERHNHQLWTIGPQAMLSLNGPYLPHIKSGGDQLYKEIAYIYIAERDTQLSYEDHKRLRPFWGWDDRPSPFLARFTRL
jgi:hypothetical protein